MILVTTNYIPGKEFEMLGIVTGNMVQSKHLGKDIGAGLKSLVGGELKAYTAMMDESRVMATNRMIEQAEALRADAVINVRYATSAIVQGAAELIVYGTAVRFV